MDEELFSSAGDQFAQAVDTFLNLAGSNPFAAMWYLFLKGGWILFAYILLWAAKEFWLEHVQEKYAHKKEFFLLKIIVPRASEQTVKAVENLFANFAGMYSGQNWTEKWIQGVTQSPVSVEIVSIDGIVSFYVYAEKKFRDLVEASIYAQYPDADIMEVEDYAKAVPSHYPDEEWDLYGTELQALKPDPLPIKTYPEFEDKVSGEFKDPLAVMLEAFSRIGQGEQIWYQIVAKPTDQKDFRKRAEEFVNKLKGIKKEHKASALDFVASLPVTAITTVGDTILGTAGIGGGKKEEKKNDVPKIMQMSPGEKNVLEAVERKMAKHGFDCKIRFIYVGKRTSFKKARAMPPFNGFLKQVNTFDMQSFKPESKRVGLNSDWWWFKDARNNVRKGKILRAYRSRSSWTGLNAFFLSTEELATLWHFPILMQVRAPQLQRTEAKKVEPPANLPFG